tara:strand:- start:28 stop:195 length:168 start_codon:yes stop_codon:yes gene_type:complete
MENLELFIDTNEEILLTEDQRLVVYPIKHQKIWNMYKIQQKCFWTADEIDFPQRI